MAVEPGRIEDIDGLVGLGRLMHAESPRWNRLEFSEQRVRQAITALIQSPDGLVLVAKQRGNLVGGLLAVMSLDWMSEQRTAQELALFMLPAHRGGLAACRLISGLMAWAKLKDAKWVEAGISTGVSVERTAALHEALGFKRCGITLESRNV